jgi:predicted unusual protein kinase regulating ubiquinone biosynthesis (AarF/ABC1/UbiB family)
LSCFIEGFMLLLLPQMMLVDNLIHSDLHPGNILVRLEPPQGLLGLAYKTLRSLANPDGPVMKALGSAVDSFSKQQQQQPDSSSTSSSSFSQAAADALTVASSGAAADNTTSCSSSSSRQWDVRSLCAAAAAAARDPAAALVQLQSALAGVAAGWLQPHIVLLDVGMATELSLEDQKNMVGLFRWVVSLWAR